VSGNYYDNLILAIAARDLAWVGTKCNTACIADRKNLCCIFSGVAAYWNMPHTPERNSCRMLPLRNHPFLCHRSWNMFGSPKLPEG
jgi:hypothetical protein